VLVDMCVVSVMAAYADFRKILKYQMS